MVKNSGTRRSNDTNRQRTDRTSTRTVKQLLMMEERRITNRLTNNKRNVYSNFSMSSSIGVVLFVSMLHFDTATGFNILGRSIRISKLDGGLYARKNSLSPLASDLYDEFCTDEATSDPDDPDDEEEEIAMLPICRIVSRADSRLPSNPSILPRSLLEKPYLLDKLDAYYHAQGHRQTQDLAYLRPQSISSEEDEEEEEQQLDPAEEERLVSSVRTSLENAGFELLSKRDIDLCESLNAGYLLRLSILPDVSELDQIAQEFYPERFDADGNAVDGDDTLFEGRVLVYWRSYSKEVTKGRLILPKLDYLQANLVQRFASWINRGLGKIEKRLAQNFSTQKRKIKTSVKDSLMKGADSIRNEKVSQFFKKGIVDAKAPCDPADDSSENGLDSAEGSIKLGRYGGSKVRFVGSPDPGDALEPFLICEVKYYEPSKLPTNLHYNGTGFIDDSVSATEASAEKDMNDQLNHQGYTCEYDALETAQTGRPLPRMQLLERISISNLVDLFSKSGRKKFIKALFKKSQLVEPTYKEVVVVWRPLEKQERVYRPPKFISEFADMFDVEGFEQPPKEDLNPPKSKLEIRTFEDVPMANLQAVLPKTKLIFRPADAFLFDMISVATFFLVFSSVRLDSPKLDLLALISITLWTIRTVIRYSNKLARYDLLVKTFLTSKISHRNEGALKYIITEAGSQRAIRSSVVHTWVSNLQSQRGGSVLDSSEGVTIPRSDVQRGCLDEVNKLLKTSKEVQVDIEKALDDLEELNVVKFSNERDIVVETKNARESSAAIKKAWINLLDDELEEEIGFKALDNQTVVNGSDVSIL